MLQSSPSEMLACILATPLGLFVFLLSFKRRLLTAYLVNYITLKFRFSVVEQTSIKQAEWNLNNRIQLGIFVFTRKPHMKKDTVCKWNFMDVHQRKVNVLSQYIIHIYVLIHSLHWLPSWQKDIYKMSWRCLFKTRKTSCQDIVQMSKRCLIVDDLQVSYRKMSCRCLIGDDLQMYYQKMSCRFLAGNALNMFYIICQCFI